MPKVLTWGQSRVIKITAATLASAPVATGLCSLALLLCSRVLVLILLAMISHTGMNPRILKNLESLGHFHLTTKQLRLALARMLQVRSDGPGRKPKVQTYTVSFKRRHGSLAAARV
jgi:hypothetical protein